MNAPARFDDGSAQTRPAAVPFDDEDAIDFDAAPDRPLTSRHDGWTPARQHAFLSAVAEGHSVQAACRFVGLTVSSAYAFRRRAGGAAFALGWQAAALLARDMIADTLAARAIDGQMETITRADGSVVTRHRYDNRLAMATLTRLDRLADAGAAEGTHQAARMIATDWEAYLATIERGAGPARAGLFLGLRTGEAAEGAGGDLDPLMALARADRFVRTGAARLDELDIGDLDPARRGEWTAAEWARAEAAGLLVLAPPPAPDPVPAEAAPKANGNPPLPPLRSDRTGPVWWSEEREAWMTCFPPPGDAVPMMEHGAPGDWDYERILLPDEEEALEAARGVLLDDPLPDADAERDAWFAGVERAMRAALRDAGVEGAADVLKVAEPDIIQHHPGEGRGPIATSLQD